MLHITALLAREMGKKISVLFIDWEAQFSSTIAHCKRMRDLYKDVIDDFYWAAIPLTTQNALTQFEPEWQCWEPGAQWVRQPLKARLPTRHFSPFTVLAVLLKALSRALQSGFRNSARPPFWWVSAPMNPDNRFLTIASRRKQRFADDKPWTTAAPGGHAWYVYPLYDWKTADIWTWFAHSQQCYNPLYDLMYQAGVPPRNMRICEPFGPEQRQGFVALPCAGT